VQCVCEVLNPKQIKQSTTQRPLIGEREDTKSPCAEQWDRIYAMHQKSQGVIIHHFDSWGLPEFSALGAEQSLKLAMTREQGSMCSLR
jgi:hypothetical protein